MDRFRTIPSLILIATVVLVACQPAATPFPEEGFVATEAPVEAEAPVATEPPADVPTDEPSLPASDMPDSASAPTAASQNESDSSSSSEANAAVIEMTPDNWGEVVDQSPLPVLLYLWSPSNEASVALQPALEEIANEYAGRIKVASVNLDDYPDIGYYYTVFTDSPLPILFLLVNGNQEPWLEGVTSKDEITEMLDQHLAGNPDPNESSSLPPAGSTATVVEITSSNWEEEVFQSSMPVLIHFWAEWSGPSRLIEPTVQEIANEYADSLKVGRVNVDDYPDIVAYFGVEELPTFILLNQGSETARLAGVTSKEEIIQMLNQQLP